MLEGRGVEAAPGGQYALAAVIVGRQDGDAEQRQPAQQGEQAGSAVL
ncbi:hypothetical protein [uncultured Thiodictyon sp.]|nr:hypothetical protein [uncultured Thiodictyon sp.]